MNFPAVAVVSALLATASPSNPRPIYVDPSGSDTTGNGTTLKPFQSLDRARQLLESRGWVGPSGTMAADQLIYLNAGTYPATSSTWTDADSGANGHIVQITPTSGVPDDAVLAGAYKLPDSCWVVSSGSVYKCLLPAVPGTTAAIIPHELWEGEVRGTLARTPNISVDPRWPSAFTPYFLSACNGTVTDSRTVLQYDPVDITPTGLTVGNYDVRAFSVIGGVETDWFQDHIPVASLDSVNHRFSVLAPDGLGFKFGGCSGAVGARYVVEGDLTQIDQAGEWALGPAATGPYVYLRPRAGGAPTNVWVATTSKVLAFVGTDASHLVQNVQVTGMGFNKSDFGQGWFRFGQSDSDFYGPYQQQLPQVQGGLVFLKNAARVTVTKSHLRNSGLAGYWVEGYGQNLTLSDSWLQNCGADCVFADGPAPGTSDTLTNNSYSNLVIQDCGQRTATSCIRLQQTSHNTLSRLEITGAPRAAIVMTGWGNFPYTGTPCNPNMSYTTNNTITGLWASDLMSDTGDQGAVTWEFGDRCFQSDTFTNSAITSVYSNPSMQDFPSIATTGVFCDNQSDGVQLSNLNVAHTQNNRFRTNDNDPGSHGIAAGNDSFNADGTVNGSFDITKLDYSQIGISASHPFAAASRYSFFDGFEAGAGNWSVNTGSLTVSTAQHHDGTHSLLLGQVNGQVGYMYLPHHVHQKVRVWLYDTATDTVDIMVRCGDEDPNANIAVIGNGWLAIGVYPDATNANYSYWLGGLPFANHDTGIARTTGWHSLDFDFSAQPNLTLSLDGTALVTTAQVGFQSCSRISFGDFNGASELGTVYVDGVQVL